MQLHAAVRTFMRPEAARERRARSEEVAPLLAALRIEEHAGHRAAVTGENPLARLAIQRLEQPAASVELEPARNCAVPGPVRERTRARGAAADPDRASQDEETVPDHGAPVVHP